MSNSILQGAFSGKSITMDTNIDMQTIVNTAEEIIERDNVADAIYRCNVAVESLNALHGDLDDTIMAGKVDGATAVMAGHAVAGVMAGLGATIPVASVESIGQPMAAADVALETIGTFLEDIWTKIKEFVAKWVQKVKEFWNKHVSSAGRLAKAAKSLSEKAGKVTGSKKESKLKIGSSNWGNLAISGSFKSDNIVTGLDKYADAIDDTTEALDGLYDDFIKDYDDAASDIKDLTSLVDTTSSSNSGKYFNRLKFSVVRTTLKGNDITSAYNAEGNGSDAAYVCSEDGDLLGNKRYLTILKTKDLKIPNAISDVTMLSSIKSGLYDYTRNKIKPAKSDVKVDALSTSDIASIADSVEALANNIVKSNNSNTANSKASDDMKKSIDGFLSAVKDVTSEEGASDADKAKLKLAQSNVKTLSSVFSDLLMYPLAAKTSVTQQALASAHAAYSYATKSLSNIKTV